MKIIKTAALPVALLCAFALFGCGGPSDPPHTKLSYDPSVDDVEYIAYLTGPEAPVDTKENWQVGGTDLGFPIYNKTNGTMYVAFGDTFMNASNQSGLWRSNVLGITKDFDLSDGISFESFKGNGVVASAIFEGQHIDYYEMTRIPTGGVEVNGVMYYYYFSKNTWTYTAEIPVAKSMNYGGCVKSEDGGATWERVNDLSWLDPSLPSHKDDIEQLANQTIDMADGGKVVTMETHSGFSFTQIFPLDGKDGYIYLFGEGGYRSGGIRLARVAYADIESFGAYEYFNGIDEEGNPVWLKGHEGLLEAEKNANSYICDGKCSEQSAMYNAYLGKWMVTYLLPGTGIVYRTADKIWGPWSAPMTLVPAGGQYPFPNQSASLYAGIVHEKWTEQNGKVFYLVISQWKPVYNSSVMRITLV